MSMFGIFDSSQKELTLYSPVLLPFRVTLYNSMHWFSMVQTVTVAITRHSALATIRFRLGLLEQLGYEVFNVSNSVT